MARLVPQTAFAADGPIVISEQPVIPTQHAMKHSNQHTSLVLKVLASTLIGVLASACSESSNSDKTDETESPADSARAMPNPQASPQMMGPSPGGPGPNTSSPSNSVPPTSGTGSSGPGAGPTPTTDTPKPNQPQSMPTSGPVNPGPDPSMGSGGGGSDDPSSQQPVGPDTDPNGVPAELGDAGMSATESMTDETATSPTAPTGVPDAPQCASVIKGELTDCADTSDADPNFSFFIASRVAMVALSDNPLGFGGNLGGLECADQICALIAECVAPGNAQTWHAFLSTKDVDAKDRIGAGPWYDVLGNKIADDASGLIGVDRPTTADGTVNHNLPNEYGCENLTPACDDVKEDNHHVLTGSTPQGVLSDGRTCNDWTSTDATPGTGPAVGLSWERQLYNDSSAGPGGGFGGGSQNWLSFANESGCAPGGNLTNDPPMGNNDGTVGSGGGYGAIYCFAVVE